MRPFAQMDGAALSQVRYVLSDIDDTITWAGELPAQSYAALQALRASGRTVVLITGRPAGWCDMIARFFPVDAVVGENGALCFYRDGGHVRQLWHDSAAVRAKNLKRLRAMADAIVAEFDGTVLAQDNPWRASDVAVDFAEEVPPLPLAVARAIKARFEAGGATAKVSSIHVNAWFGDYDKYAIFCRWASAVRGESLAALQDTAIYCGDSPNDVPMFKRFAHAVGVHSITRYGLPEEDLPAWVTTADAADGFAQVAHALLAHPLAADKARA